MIKDYKLKQLPEFSQLLDKAALIIKKSVIVYFNSVKAKVDRNCQ